MPPSSDTIVYHNHSSINTPSESPALQSRAPVSHLPNLLKPTVNPDTYQVEATVRRSCRSKKQSKFYDASSGKSADKANE